MSATPVRVPSPAAFDFDLEPKASSASENCNQVPCSSVTDTRAWTGNSVGMHKSSTLLAKYEYHRRLPHLQKAGSALFVTFCTGGRILPGKARDIVLEHWLREGGVRQFAGEGARATQKIFTPRIKLHAVVVMPDHVHALLTPRRDPDGWSIPLVDILQCCKGATAHRINRLLRLSGPVWQEESFDHVLRSEESFEDKYEYIRQTP